jgi:predicted transcriptional regulator
MFNNNLVKVLNLSAKETSVLNLLEIKTNQTIADISKETKISRMTIYPILNSLKERNLIDYHRKGARKFWNLESKDKLGEMFSNISHLFIPSGKTKVVSGASGFTIIKGLDNLQEIWKNTTKLFKGSRILGIQSTASIKDVLTKTSFKETWEPVNKAIIDKGLIVEGLIREDYYTSTYLDLYKDDKEKQKTFLKSFIGRATDMVFVKNDFLNSSTDLMIFDNTAFLVNWKDEVAVEIKNQDMLEFLKEMFHLARGYGKKVDQNEYLKKLLAEIN